MGFPPPHCLHTPRLRLRPMQAADAPALFALLRDPEVARYWDSEPWPTPEAACEFIVDEQRALAEGESLTLGIEQRADGQLIGMILLFAYSAEAARAELGFALARAAWGQGLLREAAHALIDYGFGPLGLRRIDAEIDASNRAAARALARLGFRREGLLRQRWRVAERVADAEFLGLLATEWPPAVATVAAATTATAPAPAPAPAAEPSAPALHTPEPLQALRDALCALEDRYHAAAPPATPQDFERIVASDFWEIGASGRRYSRAFCLQVLRERGAPPPDTAWITRDPHLRPLGPNHCLLTYTLEQPGRTTLRTTLWRRAGADWQAVFHQGTVVGG